MRPLEGDFHNRYRIGTDWTLYHHLLSKQSDEKNSSLYGAIISSWVQTQTKKLVPKAHSWFSIRPDLIMLIILSGKRPLPRKFRDQFNYNLPTQSSLSYPYLLELRRNGFGLRSKKDWRVFRRCFYCTVFASIFSLGKGLTDWVQLACAALCSFVQLTIITWPPTAWSWLSFDLLILYYRYLY